MKCQSFPTGGWCWSVDHSVSVRAMHIQRLSMKQMWLARDNCTSFQKLPHGASYIREQGSVKYVNEPYGNLIFLSRLFKLGKEIYYTKRCK